MGGCCSIDTTRRNYGSDGSNIQKREAQQPGGSLILVVEDTCFLSVSCAGHRLAWRRVAVCWSVPSARAAGSLAVRSRRPPLDPLDACARSRGGFLGARPRSVDPLGACAQPPPPPTPLYTSCPPPPSSPHGMEARRLAAHVVRFPGRPAAKSALVTTHRPISDSNVGSHCQQ